MIQKVQVKEYSIFEQPDLGNFDVIVADLPFGMVISKNEDIDALYQSFIQYAENHLNKNGVLGVYTSEFNVLDRIIADSRFKVAKSITLKLVTSENSYLQTKIFVCTLK